MIKKIYHESLYAKVVKNHPSTIIMWFNIIRKYGITVGWNKYKVIESVISVGFK